MIQNLDPESVLIYLDLPECCIKFGSGVHNYRNCSCESTVMTRVKYFVQVPFRFPHAPKIILIKVVCFMKFHCQNRKWWVLILTAVMLLPFQKLTWLSG
jgi:hypothetical protein